MEKVRQMDLKMNAETITSTSNPVWDVDVDDGIVPIIYDDDEDVQCATLAVFLVKSTVPQLEDAGVPWTEYLSQKISFGELDFYIREALKDVDKTTFYPQYDITDDRLTLTVGRLNQEADYNELSD